MCVVIHACAGDVCTLQVVRGLAFSHYKRKRCMMLLLLRFLAHATHVLSCAYCALRMLRVACCARPPCKLRNACWMLCTRTRTCALLVACCTLRMLLTPHMRGMLRVARCVCTLNARRAGRVLLAQTETFHRMYRVGCCLRKQAKII